MRQEFYTEILTPEFINKRLKIIKKRKDGVIPTKAGENDLNSNNIFSGYRSTCKPCEAQKKGWFSFLDFRGNITNEKQAWVHM